MKKPKLGAPESRAEQGSRGRFGRVWLVHDALYPSHLPWHGNYQASRGGEKVDVEEEQGGKAEASWCLVTMNERTARQVAHTDIQYKNRARVTKGGEGTSY